MQPNNEYASVERRAGTSARKRLSTCEKLYHSTPYEDQSIKPSNHATSPVILDDFLVEVGKNL